MMATSLKSAARPPKRINVRMNACTEGSRQFLTRMIIKRKYITSQIIMIMPFAARSRA